MYIVSASLAAPAAPAAPAIWEASAISQRQLFHQVEIASATSAYLGLNLLDSCSSSPTPGGSIPSSESRRWFGIAHQGSRAAAVAILRRIVTDRALQFISAAAHDHACVIPNSYPVKEIVAHARFGSYSAYHRKRYADYVWTLLTGDHPVDPVNWQGPFCIPLVLLLCSTSPAHFQPLLARASMLIVRTVSLIRFVLANMPDTDFASNLSSRSLLGGCLHALLDPSTPAPARRIPNIRYPPHSYLASIDGDSATSVAPLAGSEPTNALSSPSRQRRPRSPPQRRRSKKRRFADAESYSSVEHALAPNPLSSPDTNRSPVPETSPCQDLNDALPYDGRALHEVGQALLSLSASTSGTTNSPSRGSYTSSLDSPQTPLVSTRKSMPRSLKQGKQATRSPSPRTAVGGANHRQARSEPLHEVTTSDALGGQERFSHRTILIVEERRIAKRADVDRILESWSKTESGARMLVWRRPVGRRREAILEDLGCIPIETCIYDVMRIDQWGRGHNFTLRNSEGQRIQLAGEAAYVALHDRFSAFYETSVPHGGQSGLCPVNLLTDDWSDSELSPLYSPPAFIARHDWLHRFHGRAESIGLKFPRFGRILSFTSSGYQIDDHTVRSGGTAWYYLLSGQRTFNFAPSEEMLHFQLLAKSAGWSVTRQRKSPTSPGPQTASTIDLGVEHVQSVKLRQGEGLLAPGCWPRAITTHEPSVMLSSVMYHDYQIPQQIEMWTLETAHVVPDRLQYFEILTYWAMNDLHRRWSIHSQESIELATVSPTRFEGLSLADAAPLSPAPALRQTALDEGREQAEPVALPSDRDLECLIDFVEQHAEVITVHSSGTLTIETILQECMAFRQALQRSAAGCLSG